MMPIGVYELALLVVAENCKPLRYLATIDLRQWDDDIDAMLTQGIKIDIKKIPRS